MNRVSGIDGDALLRTADLAAREEFRLGEALINPGTRMIRGPGGEADLEPRVMQVLVVLADAAGTVVTRETLFQRCWGNVFVGDDSLNRAVAGVRRVAETIAGGSFSVETVPRTGYQLIVQRGIRPGGADQLAAARLPVTRRVLIGGGVAAVSAAAIGSWAWLRGRPDPRFEALMARGEEALRNGPYEDPKFVELFEQAVRLEPGNASAWGGLAFLKSALLDEASTEETARLTQQVEQAARRARAIDPDEPNALVAMLQLQGPMLDWAAREDRVREIVVRNPGNVPAMRELAMLLQAVGLSQEGWEWNQRILQLAPLSQPHLVICAMKLWILGRMAEADKMIDRVRALWPHYQFGFFTRLMLFALTDRPQAALAMLNDYPSEGWTPGRVTVWRAALKALETRSAQDIGAARVAYFDAAKSAPWGVNMAVMVLGKLGQVDAAFELTDGYLLWRGEAVSANRADAKILNDYNRRMMPWLFTPPLAGTRADPRFLKLCEELGLAAYWRKRGVKPDYMRT